MKGAPMLMGAALIAVAPRASRAQTKQDAPNPTATPSASSEQSAHGQALEGVPSPAEDQGPFGRPRVLVLVIGGGLTLMAAGIGIVAAVRASSASGDVEYWGAMTPSVTPADPNPCNSPQLYCNELHAAVLRHEDAVVVERSALITAGVLGALTATTYFLWPVLGKGSGRQARFEPAFVTTGGGGILMLHGSF